MERMPLNPVGGPLPRPELTKRRPRRARLNIERDPVDEAVPGRVPIIKQTGSPLRHSTIDPHDLYMLARIGCTIEEAAQFFGMIPDSLTQRMKTHLELRLAWDRGCAQDKISLRRLQWRHAEQPGMPGVAMTIHLSKHRLGEIDKSRVEHTGDEDNPIHVKVDREELIAKLIGNNHQALAPATRPSIEAGDS